MFNPIIAIRKLKDALYKAYWVEYSYVDNRILMFMEQFLPKRVVRFVGFHCYAVLVFTLSYAAVLMLNAFTFIPLPAAVIIVLSLFIYSFKTKAKERIAHYGQ